MELLKGGKQTPEKKPSLFMRFLAFLLTLALVLGAVAAVAYRDKFNLDAVKRYFTYRSLEKNDSGQADAFVYERSSKNAFATLGDGMLVCSPSSIRLYSGGITYVDQTVSMTNPVISSAAKSALVYDAGGRDLFVFSGKEQVFSLSLEGERSLLSASVNDAGYLAITAQESGYKGSVTIYDTSYEPVLQVNLSSSFITGAVISPDNKSVAIATAGLDAGSFESRVNLYQLDRSPEETQPDAFGSMGNNICLDLRWDSNGIWALCENSIVHMAEDASLSGSYLYTGRYLKGFSLEGDGFAALLLGKYRAGSSADLAVVNPAGDVTATLALPDQVLSISAAGRYISILTADRLDIYTQELEPYISLQGTQGARRVIQRADGSAMLIGTESARLYIP